MTPERAELIEKIAKDDVRLLCAKDASYGESWRKRGGVGAFMVTARKWDRIEQAAALAGYDIFAAARVRFADGEDLLTELCDLRCYLLLVESEIRMQQPALPRPAPPPNIEVREGVQPTSPFSTGRTPP